MSPTSRSIVQLAAGVAVLVAAIAWLSGGCGDRIGPAEEEASAKRMGAGDTAVVEASVERAVELASGTVASAHQTTVSSKILARIAEIPVRAGSVVSEGDLLVRLEGRDLEARMRAAREDLRASRAKLDLARSERERVEKLFEAEVASRQQLDQVRADARVAAADVEAATERLRDAEVALSYAEIRSPVSGRVIDRLAEPGDTAAPGTPLLRIYDPGALRLEVPVRETLAVRLAPAQPLRVRIEALDEVLEGTISEIVPFAEPGARTLLVKIRLPPNPRLFAGMFGRVEIPAGERRRLLVPQDAISRVGQLEFARVVGTEGHIERRLVTTGPPEGDGRIEVLSGLAAGEGVLLRDGTSRGQPSTAPAP